MQAVVVQTVHRVQPEAADDAQRASQQARPRDLVMQVVHCVRPKAADDAQGASLQP